jgi:hypothetical protein
MNKLIYSAVLASLALAPALVQAQESGGPVDSCESTSQDTEQGPLQVRFVESAPRDRFVFDNNTASSVTSITLDLTESVGQLLFDTTEAGEGVEVFQPFRIEGGDASLSLMPTPGDGDTVLQLNFDSFPPGGSFAFSIDVDDTLTDSNLGQIRVAGSEVAGARIQLTFVDASGKLALREATFNDDASAAACAGADSL